MFFVYEKYSMPISFNSLMVSKQVLVFYSRLRVAPMSFLMFEKGSAINTINLSLVAMPSPEANRIRPEHPPGFFLLLAVWDRG